jgi:hypothetical protein
MNAHEVLARVTGARNTASKLTIYRIPEGISTMVAIGAAAIECFPGVSIEHIDDLETISSALDAVEQSRPTPEDRPLDVRNALIFFDAQGDRVLRVYKGNFASQGQIDDQTCSFDELALHRWLLARQ